MIAHTLAALAAVPELATTLVVLSPTDDLFEPCVPGFAGWVARCGATAVLPAWRQVWPSCSGVAPR